MARLLRCFSILLRTAYVLALIALGVSWALSYALSQELTAEWRVVPFELDVIAQVGQLNFRVQRTWDARTPEHGPSRLALSVPPVLGWGESGYVEHRWLGVGWGKYTEMYDRHPVRRLIVPPGYLMAIGALPLPFAWAGRWRRARRVRRG